MANFERWPSTGYGTSVTASATAHTKGAYAEIAAATGFASSRAWFLIERATAERTYLTDLATGAGGAETVRVANVYAAAGNDAGGANVDLPLNIDLASGVRLSARTQALVGSASVFVAVMLRNRATAGFADPSTYGADAPASGGTDIDPGGTANVKGAYVQITAATSAEHDEWAIVVAQRGNTAPTFCSWSVDIAKGAGGSETIIVPDIPYQCADLGDAMRPSVFNFIETVAASTRLAIRAQCSITDAFDRMFEAQLLGMDTPGTSGTVAGGRRVGGLLV